MERSSGLHGPFNLGCVRSVHMVLCTLLCPWACDECQRMDRSIAQPRPSGLGSHCPYWVVCMACYNIKIRACE